MKLPVVEVLRETYKFIWCKRWLFLALALTGIVINTMPDVAMVALGLFQPVPFPGLEGNWAFTSGLSDLLTFRLLIALVNIAVYIMFSVAWHRAYLIHDERTTVLSAYRPAFRQVRFLLQWVKLVLLGAVLYAVFAIAVLRCPDSRCQ